MDSDDDIEIGRRTWKRATLPIEQDAFREGFEVGRKAQYQQGFDCGYRQGFRNGFKMGFINAALKAFKDLNNAEMGLGIDSYDSAHRGRCVLCPEEPFTKEQMAEVASQYKILDEILIKQNTVVFPEEEIASILNKFNQPKEEK